MLTKSEIARLRGLARHRRDRREAGRLLVEGTKLVAEVLASDLEVFGVYFDPDRCQAPTGEATPVPAHQLERIASTANPQPVVAEVGLPDPVDPASLDPDAPVLVLVDLNDPGNVGTLARSAEAAGFGALVVLGATADPWSPKTVRASAGALFRLRVVEVDDAAVGLAAIGERGLLRVGTRMLDAPACDEVDLAGPVAIVLGSEAHGLAAGHHDAIDEWVRIPMAGDLESLNVAMAGTILAYEVARQRRSA